MTWFIIGLMLGSAGNSELPKQLLSQIPVRCIYVAQNGYDDFHECRYRTMANELGVATRANVLHKHTRWEYDMLVEINKEMQKNAQNNQGVGR